MEWAGCGHVPGGETGRARFLALLLAIGVTVGAARADPIRYTGQSRVLPISAGSFGQIMGDLARTPDGAAAVYQRPAESVMNLVFYRFDETGAIAAERAFAPADLNYHGPSIAWNGQTFGVVASTLTRSAFMILSPDGDPLVAPFDLPGIPHGGRTAAFRVLWTGDAYAVFGCWLEPEYPGQDLSYGYFYTHLLYWLVRPDGRPLRSRELGYLAPMSYPGIQGAEKTYYDVAWTGAAFFVAYYSESETGPPLSTYTRMYNLAGEEIRAEAPAFAATTAKGPVVASSGQTIAVVGLREVSMTGNFMYIRFFDINGDPLAAEELFNARSLGFGPIVSWQGGRFVTAYADLYDYDTLGYGLFLNEFDGRGARLGPEYQLVDGNGAALRGTMALGVDLQLAGDGRNIFGKSQTSDPYLITVAPRVFLLTGVDPVRAALIDHILGTRALTGQAAAEADRNADGLLDVADVVGF